MKLFRYLSLAAFIVLLGLYINIVTPAGFIRADDSSNSNSQTQTQDDVTPTDAPSDSPTDSPTNAPTTQPTDSPFPTSTPTPIPAAAASCSFSPSSLSVKDGETGKAAIFYSTQNLPVNAKHITVCVGVDNGAPTYVSDTGADYGSNPVSQDVTGGHTYTTFLFLKNASDDPKTCSGTVINTCSMATTVNNCDHTNQGGNGNNNNNNCNDNNNNNNNSNNQNQGQNQGQTQNNHQEQNFNPTINDTNNNNITLNGLATTANGTTVYNPSNATSLPSTGTPFMDLLGIFTMSGAGFVIRKFTKLG